MKLINTGITGAGKTGALASLCAAGYEVRLIDLEDGAKALINVLAGKNSKYPPDAIKRLRWITLTEPMRVLNGVIVPRAATVWAAVAGLLERWSGDYSFDAEKYRSGARFDDCVVKNTDSLGTIYNWKSNCVLALDTLGRLAEAAKDHKLQMEGKLGQPRSSMEAQRDMGSAQLQVDKFLQFMCDANLKCNVVVNTHLNWAQPNGKPIPMTNPPYDGPVVGFPSAIGSALNEKVGRGFNDLLYTVKDPQTGLQQICAKGVQNVGVKSSAPLNVKDRYPLQTGLADYFRDCGA